MEDMTMTAAILDLMNSSYAWSRYSETHTHGPNGKDLETSLMIFRAPRMQKCKEADRYPPSPK